MSTTLEAPAGTNEAEVQEAIDVAELARRSQEAAATGMTQQEREAAAEHDGTPSDAAAPAETPAKPPRKPRTPKQAQGTLEGAWEQLVGGEPDTEIKVSLSKPAGVHFDNQPEKLLKQTVHRILITTVVTEFASSDTLDPDTHDVKESKGKRKLRVTSGVFLDPDEYIASAGDDVDVAAEAAAAAEQS